MKSLVGERLVHSKWIKYLAWLPAICMACIIFGFSSQEGTQSSGISEKVAGIIVDAAEDIFNSNVSEADRQQMIQDLQFPIRKCAHITEYMILTLLIGVGLYAWNIRDKRLMILECAAAFIFACTDEFHQLFVPERSGQFKDVMIDSIGILAAIIITYIIVKSVTRARE